MEIKNSEGMDRSIPLSLALAIILVVAVLTGILLWSSGRNSFFQSDVPPGISQGVQCTMEARECPDGSYVGRSGPNCEFAACPEGKNSMLFNIDTNDQTCSKDDECGMFLSECSCSCKGIAINNNFINKYLGLQEEKCRDYVGPFCEINCEYPPIKCIEGKCEVQSLVGNDRDSHGCIGSAGYAWCEEKQKCLREWEEKCGSSRDCSETCPSFVPPAPGYCEGGTIIPSVQDECGCWGPPGCREN